MERPRRPRLLVTAALLIAAALAASACESRALMSPDGRYVYWGKGSSPPTPQRITTADLASIALAPIPGGSNLRAGLIAPDGATGYAVTADGEIHRLSLPDGTEVGTPAATSLGVLNTNIPMAAIAPDGSTAILGSPTGDLLARIDLGTLTETTTRSIGNGSAFAQTAAFTPDGQYLIASQSRSGPASLVKVRVSDLAVVAGPTTAGPDATGVAGIVLSDDGTVGYAVGETGVFRFDVATLEPTGAITNPATLGIQQGSLMRSPDGERLYLLDTAIPGLLHTFDLPAMRELPTQATTLPTAEAWGALTPDGRTVYLGDENGYHERIDVATANALALSVTGPGAVRVSTAATACTGSCAYDILDYRTVTLTASPSTGASFAGWGGACSGAAASCVLPMTAARSVTAAFTASAATPATTAPSNRIRALRSTTHVGADAITFTTTLQVPGPGRVRQSVAIVGRGRRLAAGAVLCRASAQPTTAGPVTLVCTTGPRAPAALARTSLRLRMATAFRPVGGSPGITRRTIVLSRTALPTPPPVTG